MKDEGVIDVVDVVAVHGFPLDWNHWQIDEWPDKLAEIRGVTDKPIWVSEVGVSTFGAEEVQEFGLARTAKLLSGRRRASTGTASTTCCALACDDASSRGGGLLVLPARLHGTLEGGRHAEEGAADVLRSHAGGRTLPVVPLRGPSPRRSRALARAPRREEAAHGLSWADSHRPNVEAWFDRQMRALEPFDVTVTFCFTPGSRGVRDDHTSPPLDVGEFAEFCTRMVRRDA